LAHKFNFKVIAEGVEYIEQYKILDDLGCDYMQGYLGSKPVEEKLILEEYSKLLNIKNKIDGRVERETNKKCK
jgi:EAL domain-containing protein (putative c-di-GMP-specific phosphodiesterase class I)